jgi:predicted metal-binding membrane protein
MRTAASDAPSRLERVVRHDRLLMALSLLVMTALAWGYLVRAAGAMQAMNMEAQMHAAMGMADMRPWGIGQWLELFTMWTVMMVGMMVPSAAPVMLLVLGVYRRRHDARARRSAAAFVAGYLLCWTMFSAAAAGAQVALHRGAVMAPDMRLRSAAAAGVVLLCAGVYQWLPIKTACLTRCRSPFGFVAQFWREGAGGALRMGIRHGLFCVGCCSLLMVLLFVVGVMNLFWVAAIAGFVLVEKVMRGGAVIGRVAGIALAVWGLYLLASA